MRRHLRKVFLALIVLAALFLIAYLSRRRIHLADFTWSKFKYAVGQANPWLLFLSVAAIYGCYIVRALRWQRFSRYLGPSSFVDVFSATVMGFAAIFLLGRPGEPVRPLLLSRKSRFNVGAMFGIWVLERMFDFAAAAGLAILSLLVFSAQLLNAGANQEWITQAQTAGSLLLAIVVGIFGLMF